MAKQLNEKQVLRKLGIPDFRHLTKEKAITLVNMLDRVDPRVAMEAIKQFPELSKMLFAEAKEYREVIFRAFDSSDASNKAAMDAIDAVIAVLSCQLEKECLSDEERMQLSEQLVALAKMASDKDSENKRHIRKMVGMAIGGFVTLAAIAAAAVGVNMHATESDEALPDSDDDEI